jgi:hypothetical protein
MIYAIWTATHIPNNQPLHSSPRYGVKSHGLCFLLLYRQNFTVRSKSDRTDQFLLHCTSSRRRQTDCPNPCIHEQRRVLPTSIWYISVGPFSKWELWIYWICCLRTCPKRRVTEKSHLFHIIVCPPRPGIEPGPPAGQAAAHTARPFTIRL